MKEKTGNLRTVLKKEKTENLREVLEKEKTMGLQKVREKERTWDIRKILEWGVGLSAVVFWLSALVLCLAGLGRRQVWILILFILAAAVLSACTWLLHRMLFQPMDQLSDAVKHWDSTEPEDMEKQIGDLPGPMGDLAKVFYGQMNEVEQRMAGIEDTVRRRTAQSVQSSIADDICRTVLPQTLKDYPSRQYFEVGGVVSPGQRNHCTFYDYFFIDSGLLCVAVGQVSDQGVDAALLMATAQALLRSRIRLGRSVAETMNDVNTQLYDYGSKGEVCALLGTLDTAMGYFSFVNAGVCVPLLMRNGERYERIESAVSTPLGRNQNVSYRAEDSRLRQGDRLFLYTEGLEAAKNQDGTAFGDQDLRKVLNRTRTQKEPEESLQYLVAEAAAFCPSDDAHDGYAALLLEYRKGEKELAHCRVPGTSAHAGEVLEFLKTRLDENGIKRKHYARIAVLVDELFALCCRKQEGDKDLVVECGVAPDAQSVTIRITGEFHGENPLKEDQNGPAFQSADYIQSHGDYISFKAGEMQDAVSVVCFI